LTEFLSGGAVVSKIQVNGKLNISEEVLSATHVKRAAASAMAAAAVKAKLLADQEEREMQRLVTIVIEHQVMAGFNSECFRDIICSVACKCSSCVKCIVILDNILFKRLNIFSIEEYLLHVLDKENVILFQKLSLEMFSAAEEAGCEAEEVQRFGNDAIQRM